MKSKRQRVNFFAKSLVIALTLFSINFCATAKEIKSAQYVLSELFSSSKKTKNNHSHSDGSLSEIFTSSKKIKKTKNKHSDNSEHLWGRIRNNFGFTSQKDHHRVQQYIQKYSAQERNLHRVITKAAPYLYYIVEELETRGMPAELAFVPIVESAFEPQATSHKGAAGIWQFIPGTAKQYGLKRDASYDGRRDVAASTKAALDYLAYLHEEFDNNWMLALAAYNSGEGTVKKAIQRNLRAGKSTSFWSLKLPKETTLYVPQILALAEVIGSPEKHDISLPRIANKPYLATVYPGKTIDFNKMAKLAEMNVKEIYRLNPGYKRHATHLKGAHELLLPVENAKKFENNFSKKHT